ncbi:MAG: peptide chain release factor N(5)-glutamine methyltransferase [Bacteroidetes bacterium]|nr:peptide chain release factor N(5)-glutamine methyltransferase [Bacteroidota bacterium]
MGLGATLPNPFLASSRQRFIYFSCTFIKTNILYFRNVNTANTIEDIAPLFHEGLKEFYPKGELDAFVLLTVHELFGLSKEDMLTRKRQPLNAKEAERISSIVNELKTEKPIQYILGRTDFYGCKIRVNEHVLIPRPETEELVDLILFDIKRNTNSPTPLYKGELNILDIGTGSGCIAIALKKNLTNTNVSAIDISEEALLTAKANAILNQTKISFLQADITSPPTPLPQEKGVKSTFNIIVSNPPYIRISEKEKMSKNVLNYEPHLALFVKDDDPLLFYKAIAEFAKAHLTPNPSPTGEGGNTGGKLYFEINEALGLEVKKMLEEKGFKNVEIKKDMSGKQRFAIGNR